MRVQALAFAAAAVIGVAAGVVAQTRAGARAVSAVHAAVAFYAGVVCLVALSISMMLGLAATDRLVLLVRHRVVTQTVHRGLAAAAVVFLGVHVVVKLVDGRARPVDVAIPLLADHRALYVGCGTVAGYLMTVAAWTGFARGWFAAGHARSWRALHCVAYLAWPVALVHGLRSGRPAAPWVTASYALCVGLVGLALLVRLAAAGSRRRRARATAATAGARQVALAGGSPPGPARAMAVPANRLPAADREQPLDRSPAVRRDRGQLTAEPARPPHLPADPGPLSDEEFFAYLRGQEPR
jgi:hypothetical protein